MYKHACPFVRVLEKQKNYKILNYNIKNVNIYTLVKILNEKKDFFH